MLLESSVICAFLFYFLVVDLLTLTLLNFPGWAFLLLRLLFCLKGVWISKSAGSLSAAINSRRLSLFVLKARVPFWKEGSRIIGGKLFSPDQFGGDSASSFWGSSGFWLRIWNSMFWLLFFNFLLELLTWIFLLTFCPLDLFLTLLRLSLLNNRAGFAFKFLSLMVSLLVALFRGLALRCACGVLFSSGCSFSSSSSSSNLNTSPSGNELLADSFASFLLDLTHSPSSCFFLIFFSSEKPKWPQ